MGNSGVVTAEVVLDDASNDTSLTIPIGLSASVEVIGSRATDSVLIPVEALIDLGDGKYAVNVVENGAKTQRDVEVGIMDYTYAEITSGLEAGEAVSTSNSAATSAETK
jgi:HlyD family secretion protein